MTEADLSEPGFEGTPLLNFMKDVLEQEPKLRKDSVKKVKARVVLTLRNKENQKKSWFFDFKENGTVEKIEGDSLPKNDVAITMKDTDFLKLVDYKVQAQKLYLNGRLKVKGNLMKAISIETILKAADPRPKL
ncbi:oleate-induced peroxisomal protein POX18 [Hyphopichia burtonii NRRL Y-1933]|uniref:Oleate-induced peroxisomal protein POX18 n=1 Tax=Hyphopichia burtonii NRRL Y-1933 TaxID=984485 RepID=A0A1E4RNL3_9ASCO|nr:oleate-induced peroxisomal protein POX18 [Hyphopichia burtonii NRRL Y-1933]ODV68839.1 oleate-induced peroxisomal protein POX18 [Hyphopichia burtonii NRRL Y-1933]